MKITAEQARVIELAKTGESLKVSAYAGAGKTSTLIEAASVLEGRGYYIAFNKSIADEAGRKFGSNVEARTAHSMAYAVKWRSLASRLQTRLTGRMVAERFNLQDMLILQEGTKKQVLTGIQQGYLVISIVTVFMQSGDNLISRSHIPYANLLVKSSDKETVKAVRTTVFNQLLSVARDLWADMSSNTGKLPVTHDTYLKLWALDNPVINADFILFDESQDASGVMLNVLEGQRAQIIWVGDAKQQIYSWRGAVNAMEKIQTKHEARLTQSFRFGQAIADVAAAVIEHQLGESLPIRGLESIASAVHLEPQSNNNAILSRTNAACIEQLIIQQSSGKKAAMVGDIKGMIATISGIEKIRTGQKALGELSVFDNWQEFEEYTESGQGADLRTLASLTVDYGASRLSGWLEAASRTTEEEADVYISTAHRAKGREWDNVLLTDDFLDTDSDGWQEESANLLYVAVTRAKKSLDLSKCTAAQKALGSFDDWQVIAA